MLTISHLTKYYGTVPVLSDLSFSAQKGERIALIGLNGTGKTTLLRLIARLEQPTAGTISAPDNIAYLPENTPIYIYMYPREYLYFGCHNQPLAEQLIQSLHLTEHLNKPIAQLSKGYRQRLAIAKTLLSDAPLILLDEPTNGIDRLQLNDLYSLLDQLCHDRTIIISSHHIEELQLFCPRSIQLSETPSLTAPHL